LDFADRCDIDLVKSSSRRLQAAPDFIGLFATGEDFFAESDFATNHRIICDDPVFQVVGICLVPKVCFDGGVKVADLALATNSWPVTIIST